MGSVQGQSFQYRYDRFGFQLVREHPFWAMASQTRQARAPEGPPRDDMTHEPVAQVAEERCAVSLADGTDERGGNRHVRPTATAPHSDSTMNCPPAPCAEGP